MKPKTGKVWNMCPDLKILKSAIFQCGNVRQAYEESDFPFQQLQKCSFLFKILSVPCKGTVESAWINN